MIRLQSNCNLSVLEFAKDGGLAKFDRIDSFDKNSEFGGTK